MSKYVKPFRKTLKCTKCKGTMRLVKTEQMVGGGTALTYRHTDGSCHAQAQIAG